MTEFEEVEIDHNKPIVFIEMLEGCGACKTLKDSGAIEAMGAACESIGCELITEYINGMSEIQTKIREIYRGFPFPYMLYRKKAVPLPRNIFTLNFEHITEVLALAAESLRIASNEVKLKKSNTAISKKTSQLASN